MKTQQLKEICETLSSIIKNDKIRPITDLVEIYAKDGVCKLGSTDNRITIIGQLEEDKDCDNAIISLSALTKLVKLTTKESVSIMNRGKYVEFKGNGKYKIPIQLDEMGNNFYLPLDMPEAENEFMDISSSDWQKAINRNKVGLYVGEDHQEFKLYYNNNGSLVTSDSIVIANTKNMNLPLGSINNYVVEALSNIKSDMKFYNIGSGYRISTDTYEMYIVDKMYEEFPIDIVKPFLVPLDEMFDNKFSLGNKRILIDAIKRQHIFKNPFDFPSVVFEIKDKKVYIKNTEESVVEELDAECITDMSVIISTEVLLNVLKNMDDKITVYINASMIGIEDDVGSYIIASMEE